LDRGVARKQAFLQAAREVFLEHGYEAASVNEVVRRAGGSLATLYSQYGSKEGLFLAVAADQQDRFLEALLPVNYRNLPLREGLTTFANKFLYAVLHPDNVAFFRIAVGEGRKYPQLLRRYLSSNIEKLRITLSEYLKERPDENGARIALPEISASHFFDLVRSNLHYRAMCNPDFIFSAEDRDAHVKEAVEFFLHGALER
jgi:AcrR family transcriptional regulator